MKKTLLPLLLLLLLTAGAQAQLMVKAGVNAAVLDGKIGSDANYKILYHAGASYQYVVAGPLSIQPELLYSVQGTERKSDVEEYATKLHYLNLPILAKLSFGPVFMEAGPQFGILLTAKDVGTMLLVPPGPGAPAQYGKVNRQVEDNYKKGDFSLCAGAGFKLGSMLVGGRFNAGLSDINGAKNLSGINDTKLKNRVVQGYVAFQLGGQ